MVWATFCLCVIRVHLFLACCSAAIIHKRIRCCSYDHPHNAWHLSSSHCLSIILQTKYPFILIWKKMQHLLVTLWLSNTSKCCHSSKCCVKKKIHTPKRVSIVNMTEIPINVYQCVHRGCKRKTFVTLQMCLINVYSTMATVLWSSLVRLIVGLHCDFNGIAKQNTGMSVCILYNNVFRGMHQSVWVVVLFSSSSQTQHLMLLDLGIQNKELIFVLMVSASSHLPVFHFSRLSIYTDTGHLCPDKWDQRKWSKTLQYSHQWHTLNK